MPRKIHAQTWSIKRNKSWLASVKVGLNVGLWNMPASLVYNLKFPIFAILGSIGSAFTALIYLVAIHLLLIVAGLCGFVVEEKFEMMLSEPGDEANQG